MAMETLALGDTAVAVSALHRIGLPVSSSGLNRGYCIFNLFQTSLFSHESLGDKAA